MKKNLKFNRIIALALALLAALGLVAAPVLAETVPAEAPAAEEAALDPQAVFEQATEGLLGVTYENDGLVEQFALSEEVDLYGFLCRATTVAPDAQPRLCILIAAKTVKEGVLLMDVMDLPVTDAEGAQDVPETEYLVVFFEAFAQLPVGTAGSSLQAAKQVSDTWLFCAMHDYTQQDADVIAQKLHDALLLLPEEERALYKENAPAILAEVRRLCDPAEALGGEYADAGVAGILETLRAEAYVPASVQAFLGMLDTLEP